MREFCSARLHAIALSRASGERVGSIISWIVSFEVFLTLKVTRPAGALARESFMPGVLLAIRRVGDLRESPVVGLERLLF